jgi:hypothetical protein
LANNVAFWENLFLYRGILDGGGGGRDILAVIVFSTVGDK